jgi:hypothetical protein
MASLLTFLLLFLAAPALAQDAGGFVSPGPLAEPHAHLSGITQCFECHTLGAGVSDSKCMDCHDTVSLQVSTRTGFHADKQTDCASCHPDHRGPAFDMVRLEVDDFDHDATGFTLVGEHAAIECLDCHEPDTWAGLDDTCLGCHRSDEPHGLMASRPRTEQCESCHGSDSWGALPLDPVAFDHSNPSHADYALEGQHRQAECVGCHVAWKFAPIDAEECSTCHDTVHGKQFGDAACDDCHTVQHADFALRNYDHDTTDFPLTGQHVGVSCEACHGDGEAGQYRPLAHDRCETCHEDPHGGQFAPRDCDACHSVAIAGFEMLDFDHDATDFPLNRAHAEVACEECHGDDPSADFANLPFDDCATCHEDPHEQRFDPERCDSCHLDGTWEVETFDHDLTDYPLDGAHVGVECESCHTVNGEALYAGLPHESCLDCHAEEEPHEGHFVGAACTDCHVTEAWPELHMDHFGTTGFPLEDAHDIACSECHDHAAFEGEESACESCHERPVPHYEGDCETCHLPTSWEDGAMTVESHALTHFPLQGIHQHTACAECHEPGRPSNIASPVCSDCHRGDDPHRNLLGDACEDCHGPTDWTRTRFHHGLTGWPLRGAHRIAVCNDCHATRFAGTPSECFRCHAGDKPNDTLHAQPVVLECETCHRPYDWESVRAYPHGDYP